MTRRQVLRVVMALPTAWLTRRTRPAAAAVVDVGRAAAQEPFVDHAGWIVPARDRDTLVAAREGRS